MLTSARKDYVKEDSASIYREVISALVLMDSMLLQMGNCA
jgi:hypothetical protein